MSEIFLPGRIAFLIIAILNIFLCFLAVILKREDQISRYALVSIAAALISIAGSQL